MERNKNEAVVVVIDSVCCSRYILALFTALMVCSCKDRESVDVPERTNAHEVVIDDFQATQLRFQSLVTRIRDTQSYDAAAPKLKQLVRDFERIASELEKLDPPDAELSRYIRSKIEKGNEAAEPTDGDMMNLLLLEGREEQVADWLEAFVSSGQKVGKEFKRLYALVDKDYK